MDLKAYRDYLTGVHEDFFLSRDRETEKKVREMK
jgi:hypothetical protein